MSFRNTGLKMSGPGLSPNYVFIKQLVLFNSIKKSDNIYKHQLRKIKKNTDSIRKPITNAESKSIKQTISLLQSQLPLKHWQFCAT